MSILIKDLKIPENCGECQLCYDYIDCMAASHTIRINFDTRPKECPLVEVPALHEKLMQTELLKADLTDRFKEVYKPALIKAMIDDAPTIIEAEGEEEDG